MNKLVTAVLAVFASSAFAFNESPYSTYSSKDDFTNRTTITFNYDKDIGARCERESRARGNNGFGQPVAACSFWVRNGKNSTCDIFLPVNHTPYQLGHEVQHCKAGSFH